MKFAKRSTAGRVVLVAGTLLCSFGSSTPATHFPLNERPHSPEGPALASHPEVRLRKLHLVRPDLIPYPIALEIYC